MKDLKETAWKNFKKFSEKNGKEPKPGEVFPLAHGLDSLFGVYIGKFSLPDGKKYLFATKESSQNYSIYETQGSTSINSKKENYLGFNQEIDDGFEDEFPEGVKVNFFQKANEKTKETIKKFKSTFDELGEYIH